MLTLIVLLFILVLGAFVLFDILSGKDIEYYCDVAEEEEEEDEEDETTEKDKL